MRRSLIIAGIVLVAVVIFFTARSERSEEIVSSSSLLEINSESSGQIRENGGYKKVSAGSVKGAVREFDLSFSILEGWEVETINRGRVLNIYDPAAQGQGSLEKSKIFSWFFKANDFQTLPNVNILSRLDHEVNGRSAVTYVISKKETTPDFENEPSWRNETHKATDIRLSPQNPSLFFVFAKSPDLTDDEFQRFLKSIQFN